jgi:hypothetical protein
MCGDEPEQDLLVRLTTHAGTKRGTSDETSVRKALSRGETISADGIYEYMDELFGDAVAFALEDLANARIQDRENIVRSQSIVLARVAGLLAAQLGGRDDLISAVMSSLLDGYAAKPDTAAS